MFVYEPYEKLVVIEYANSEIGTIQDIQQVINICHFYNAIVYVDCTGSISQIPVDVKKLNVDGLGFSAHKLGALKGTGVLYKKSSIELEPLIYGSQEHGLFSGTENLIGIAALGKAVENYNYSSVNLSANFFNSLSFIFMPVARTAILYHLRFGTLK